MHECCLCLDGVDIGKESLQFLNLTVNLGVSGIVSLDLPVDALSVEGMEAGENIELAFEDGLLTKIAFLLGIDSYVFVSLLSLLLSQLFGALGVLGELLLQIENLRVVLIEALTEMLLHVFNLGIFGEQRQEIIDLEYAILQNFKGSRDIDFKMGLAMACDCSAQGFSAKLVCLFLGLIVEKMLGNLHP